mmetsp:Transcript_5940/g.9269  ORF Transcript_5940/g.9269 Transcript_5940/m.9269 type:complete len:81 (+) Transcript_5940:326-568(+)
MALPIFGRCDLHFQTYTHNILNTSTISALRTALAKELSGLLSCAHFTLVWGKKVKMILSSSRRREEIVKKTTRAKMYSPR